MMADHQNQGSNGGSGGPIFVMQTMQSPSERYLSTESLENDRHSTTSSTESPNGSVHHRKDHEFIPTRTKTINASKPAADPNKFTKVPSNPLLISAQKQIMQAEEIKKRKESNKAVVKKSDDEPDWQSNLSSWKNRRRKQSEEALQRVAEVKALEDPENPGEPRKIIGRKLSSLLYTSGEDLDWSEMGLDKEEEEEQMHVRRTQSVSPPSIPEESEAPAEQPEWAAGKVQNWTEVIRQDAPKRAVSSPVVTYAQRNSKMSLENSQQPQVRRKSSEMSATMKERLEAFKAENVDGAGPSASGSSGDASQKNSTAGPIEPDQKFHQKLMAFRKISEGKLDVPPDALKPKPPQSISSLLAGSTSQSRSSDEGNKPNEDFDNDTLDDVDQLLDDALEESYRSVLEEKAGHGAQNGQSDTFFNDQDFKGNGVKAPPAEKPPPPPAEEKRGEDEIGQQERAIIASLEMEEREHNRYIMEKMKRLPTPSSANNSSAGGEDSGIGSNNSKPAVVSKISSNKSSMNDNMKNNYNNAQQQPKKRSTNEQRTYNQHWLIQEAEQRRIAEMQQQQQTSSIITQTPPGAPPPQSSMSPVYENSQYVNQRIIPSAGSGFHHPVVPQPPPPVQNENVYANLGTQPPMPTQQMPTNFHRDGRIPGPQVPPRNPHESQQPGTSSERVLSVSGKKLCSHCNEELGRGAAVIIESLRLYYHLRCFQCCVCHIQLGNGAKGTDVRVRNNELHCQNCYSNDEGLKFSKV